MLKVETPLTIRRRSRVHMLLTLYRRGWQRLLRLSRPQKTLLYPKLAAKLQKELLPEGPNIQEACDGFKHLGDCVCAIHVSKNLGVPLPDLKAKVTGKGAEKIENAIHELKPDVDAKAEKKKAWKQAEKEIPVSN